MGRDRCGETRIPHMETRIPHMDSIILSLSLLMPVSVCVDSKKWEGRGGVFSILLLLFMCLLIKLVV